METRVRTYPIRKRLESLNRIRKRLGSCEKRSLNVLGKCGKFRSEFTGQKSLYTDWMVGFLRNVRKGR